MRVIHSNHRRHLGTVETAALLGVSRSTLAKWRMKGIGARYHHCGPRLVYYFEDEIQAWLDACDKGELEKLGPHVS